MEDVTRMNMWVLVRPFLMQGIGSLVNFETIAVRTLVDEMLGFGKSNRGGAMRIVIVKAGKFYKFV